MGIISALTSLVNGPYRYRAGPDRLGIGVENLALVVPGPAVPFNFNSPAYNVRMNLNPTFPTVPQLGYQMLPDYDLRQNGAYLTGTVKLGGLVDLSEGG